MSQMGIISRDISHRIYFKKSTEGVNLKESWPDLCYVWEIKE